MTTSQPNSAIISEYKSELLAAYLICAATTIICYEYLFTIKHEWRFLRQKWTAATWIFLINRYLMVADAVISFAPASRQTCYAMSIQSLVAAIQLLLPFVIVAVFSALRVYALLDHSYKVSVIVLFLGLVPVATSAYGESQLIFQYVNDPVLGSSCYSFKGAPPSTNLALVTRFSTVAADIIVVVVTWFKTYRQVRQAASLGIQTNLSGIILRDGSVYFIALLILNVVQLLSDFPPFFQNLVIVAVFTSSLPPILISRFLINLRDANEPEGGSTGMRSFSRFSIPNFRMPTSQSFVGPMGEPLEHGAEEAWEEEGENVEAGGLPEAGGSGSGGSNRFEDVEEGPSTRGFGVGGVEVSEGAASTVTVTEM